MIRPLTVALSSNFLRTGIECGGVALNPFNYDTVRWRRKPRWLPVAKSKKFYIPVKQTATEEEKIELKRLHDHYKTAMKSIRSFLAERIKKMTTAPEVIAEQQRIEEEDHMNCVRINNEWNAEIAKLREARIAAEREKKAELILNKVQENQREIEERKKKIEEIVKLEKEKSKTYITPENIDAAIETALSTEVDYNFSVDLQGNVYKGRRAKPVINKEKIEEKLEARASS